MTADAFSALPWANPTWSGLCGIRLLGPTVWSQLLERLGQKIDSEHMESW